MRDTGSEEILNLKRFIVLLRLPGIFEALYVTESGSYSFSFDGSFFKLS